MLLAIQVAAERAKNISTLALGASGNETNSTSAGAAPAEQHGKNASTELATGEEEGGKKAALLPLDAYNNSLVMPLHEFIEHPVVHELLHNGGTMQVRRTTRRRPHVCQLLRINRQRYRSTAHMRQRRATDEPDTYIIMVYHGHGVRALSS